MPGRITKELLKQKGKPPERGSDAWTKLVTRIGNKVRNKRPVCCLSGGRRKDGWPCESPYISEASGRCRKHGMNTPRGVSHHNFSHGRTTLMYQALPTRFKEAYTASLQDDDLLSLRADIALSDVRMGELVDRLDTGESGKRWGQVGVISHALLVEAGKNDVELEKIQNLATELGRLSDHATADERQWRELKSASQHRRKLVDTERQRLKDLHAYLTAEEALAIVGRIADTVIRHVEDKAALQAILEEIQSATGNELTPRTSLGIEVG